MSSRSALDGIMPDLLCYLNIQNLRPHLKKARLLTDSEYDELEVSPNNTVQKAVEKLVGFLKRKGPKHVQMFLSALKESMEMDAHHGHAYIIELLEGCGVTPSSGSLEGSTPLNYGHPQLRATDSGICRDSPYTESAISSSPYNDHNSPRTFVYGTSSGRHQTIASSSSPHEYHFETHMNGGYQNGFHQLSQQRGVGNGYHHPPLEVVNEMGNGFYPSRARGNTLETNAPLELGRFDHIEGSKINKREIDKLRCKVIRESENITMRFATLVLAIYRLLERNHVPPEEVRLALLFLGCYRSKPPGQNASMFSSTTSDIAQAPDLAALIQGLHNYSSWFNYRLLKYIATQFGGEEGNTLITDYEDNLRSYFENLIAYQCPQFSLTNGIPEGYEQLDVKVEWDYKTCSAQDVAHFQATLADLLNLEPYVFQLKSIEEGCVLFTWAVPSGVALHILTETISHRSTLGEWQVVCVSILGRYIETQPLNKCHHVKTPLPNAIKEKEESTEHTQVLKHSSSGGSSSSTVCSSLSDTTLSKSGSSPGKRSSQHSQSDLESDLPITVVEAEILSIYSGVSGDGSCASSPTSKRLSRESQHLSDDKCLSPSRSEGDEHSHIEPGHHLTSRPYYSEDNLLADCPMLNLLTHQEVRAMSEIALNVCSPCRKETRQKTKKHFLRSPAKWLPRLFRPFWRRRCNSARQLREPTPPSFPILELTEEPYSGGGLRYFLTEQQEQQELIEPPSPVRPLSVPQIVTPSPYDSLSSFKTVPVSELLSQQSFSQGSEESMFPQNLIVPSDASNRSQSPISSGSSPRYIPTPPLHSQLSEENEVEIEYNVSIKHAVRTRANSAPHKLSYGVRHKPSFTRTREDLQHRRCPSATTADVRVASPECSSSCCPSSRTSGYFTNSQSDISNLDSPTSQVGSQFNFQGNDRFQHPKSFPPRVPIRRHSLNARSRCTTQPSPLVKSQSTHSRAFSFDTSQSF